MDISNREAINISNRTITIIGLGLSGMSAASLAQYLGANIFISDSGNSKILRKNAKSIQSQNIEYELGQHSDRIYDADLWVISPGVDQNSSIVLQAQERGIPVVGEIEFASWYTDSPILAVTGSNGKTTTAHILYTMCQSPELHGVLAGNVGFPFSEKVLEELHMPDRKRVYVLEISSFQVEYIHHFRPFISIFLNITPDHLDRYASFDEYFSTKLKLIWNQKNDDFIIYNAADNSLDDCFNSSPATKIPFSLQPVTGALFNVNRNKIFDEEHAKLIGLNEIALPGKHNLANLLAAASAAQLMGVSKHTIAQVMTSFAGVVHRLEHVATLDGVTYINDSKATNVDAVKVALESYSHPIILILGGKDKGGDFTQLLPHTHNLRAVIAYGQAQHVIATALEDAVRLHTVWGLNDAVAKSQQLANPGDIILLSPGCASFDQFKNFEERGDRFKEFVHNMNPIKNENIVQ